MVQILSNAQTPRESLSRKGFSWLARF